MQNYQKPRDLSKEKSRLHEIAWVKVIHWVFISVGAISLAVSLILNSQILAFIGLGLVFWGAILLFIQPEKYVKKVLLDATSLTSFETLSLIINGLDYRGKAIYLPPEYFKDPETSKVYLPKQQGEKTPELNQILNHENKLFFKNPDGILFAPPGSQLTDLFEKRLGTSFTKIDLHYFMENLPKLFVDDLEIAENLEIKIKSSKPSLGEHRTNHGTILVKLTNSIFKGEYNKNKMLSEVYKTIGSPISSAIACALTKVTGRPVIIKGVKSFENGKIIELTYQIEKLECHEKIEAPIVEATSSFFRHYIFPHIVSFILILLGFSTLLWIGVLALYEMIVWNKSLDFVLFTSRVGEPISLGIGMKMIYYFVIGAILLLTGIFSHFKKRDVI